MQYLTDMMPRHTDSDADAAKKELLTVSFNQCASSIAVGHDEGYALYSLKSLETLEPIHEGKTPSRVYVVQRLFGSSLITLVSMDQSRKLSVHHYAKNNEICCHGYSSAVLAVRLNRKRVIVCLEESIHVHNIVDMRLLHVIKETPKNALGLVDLSADDSRCYLAYPGSTASGHVHIFDADRLNAECGFAAHDGPLAAMQFSPDGSKLATASAKGTVIRVFDVPKGTRLHEFTRGMKRCVTIHSLAFSDDSSLLCSSSNTETIHVYSLLRPEPPVETQKADESAESLSSWVNYFSAQATAYLPTHMNELMLREKSVCTARLPMFGTRTAVALPRIDDRLYLAAGTSDGYLFIYALETGGNECALVRQFRIGPKYGDDASIPLGTTSARGAMLVDVEETSARASTATATTPAGAAHDAADAPTVGKSPSAGSTGSTPPDRQRRSSSSLPLFASSPPSATLAAAAAAGARQSRPLEAFRGDSDESAGDDDDDAIGTPPAALDDEFPPL